MAEPLVAESATAGGQPAAWRRALVIGVVIALVVAAATFWLGTQWGGRTQTATVYCFATAGAVSCGDEPGYGDYAGAADVAWTEDESDHLDGRPACLDGGDREIQVVIGYEEVDSNGTRLNRVVWVDCDSAVPVP